MKARKLPRLMKVFIRANARYFCRAGYEPPGTIIRVHLWLNGVDDKETEAKIACWVRSDQRWIKEVWKEAARHFWYFWPAVWLMSHCIQRWLEDALRGAK